MEKQEILKNYKKEEDRLLVAKVLDKIELAKTRNKITNTDFLDMYQKGIVQKLLNRINHENYIFFGGNNEAERTIVIFYPNKFNVNIVEKNYNNIMQIIEIILPNDLKGKYAHRDYLGALMKLGIKREKIGDIIVFEEGANIVVLNETIKFIENNLKELTRFSKSNIEIKAIEQLKKTEIKKETIQIIVASLRLDNIVSELARTSRTKATEIINIGKVFVNFENITKDSKEIKEGDIITIRGKGRFTILQVEGNTKKGRKVVLIEKYL